MPGPKTTRRLIVGAVLFIGAFVALSCRSRHEATSQYRESIENWRKERVEKLKSEDSWLTLVGLYWLKEGPNTVGSGPSNDIVLPAGKAPDTVGTLVRDGDAVTLEVKPGVEVTHDGKRVETLALQDDREGKPTTLSLGSLRFFTIVRGSRVGLRVKDIESPLRVNFEGIDYFPVDPRWRKEARLEPYDPPRKLAVPNVLGSVSEVASPGAVAFTYQGQTYRLEAIGEPDSDSLFIVFGDKTNGEETYGGGRFLYAPAPDAEGRTVLDFNTAYSPPCLFTPYATCPLPPAGNRLPFPVEAGEKKTWHAKGMDTSGEH